MKGVGEVMMIAWASEGLRIEHQDETQESFTIWISVPEHSYHLDAHDEEMAGAHLAKRYKEVLTEMGIKRLTIKYKIRKGEYWTKEMSDAASLDMRKMIFGSQY